MSVAETNWPAATADPLFTSVPAAGRLVMRTASSAFGGLSFGSLNPKSAAPKAREPSCGRLTEKSAPAGASLTLATAAVCAEVSGPSAVPCASV